MDTTIWGRGRPPDRPTLSSDQERLSPPRKNSCGELIHDCRGESSTKRGHGTYVEDEQVISSVTGTIDRVNKLISVRALKSRSARCSGPTTLNFPLKCKIYARSWRSCHWTHRRSRLIEVEGGRKCASGCGVNVVECEPAWRCSSELPSCCSRGGCKIRWAADCVRDGRSNRTL